MTEMEYALEETNEAMRGIDFLTNSNGKYKLLADTHDDGTISITLNEILNKGGDAKIVMPIFSLELASIYAQCAPSRIIEHLNRDIQDAYDMIRQISEDTPDSAVQLVQATPETLPQKPDNISLSDNINNTPF